MNTSLYFSFRRRTSYEFTTVLHEKKLPTITRKKTRILEISHNPTNSICSQDHKQRTVTHTSYANFGTHPAWQRFILPRARATARRRRITATCLNMLEHASTDDTEGHAWPMSSCISLTGQALPGHPFSPTSQLSQFNWRPSARRTHFFVTFMRFTLIGADPGD